MGGLADLRRDAVVGKCKGKTTGAQENKENNEMKEDVIFADKDEV